MNPGTEILTQGGYVITANKRLSRDLAALFNQQQRSSGKQAWESPKVLPWNAWLGELHSQLDSRAQVLLSPQQENLIWEQVIADSDYSEQLLMKSAAARAARQAWNLIHAYQLDFPFQSAVLSEDGRAFNQWAQDYVKRCRQQGLIDEACLLNHVVEQIESPGESLPARLGLLGFLQWTPQQLLLLSALQQQGVEISHLPPVGLESEIECVALPDMAAEIQAAAKWAQQQVADRPDGRYGIVVPRLERVRDRIQDVFDDVLLPSSWHAQNSAVARPYNISAGRPLSSYPLISEALTILSLSGTDYPYPTISALLASCYIRGYWQESEQRALLDARLREHGEMQLRLNDIHYLARQYESDLPGLCSEFIACLDNWQAEAKGLFKRQNATAWAASLVSLLNCFGWPGQRPLDSHEYQLYEAWEELLNEFASLSLVSEEMTMQRAVSLLRRLADARLFQAASEDPPVQVIGLLEASGLRFDALRIIGLHDEVWPAPLAPNPFIPMAIQRAADLPHCSAGREFRYAEKLTEELLGSAESVSLSYPLEDGDRALRISPLISQYGGQSAPGTRQPGIDWCRQQAAEQATESWQDTQAPGLPLGAMVRGGTSLFKDQAACPFRAFANHRLEARPLAHLGHGLDPMQRGNMVHQCLQLLWERLEDQATLLRLGDDELASLLEAVVVQTIEQQAQGHKATFTERFCRLERGRLISLLAEWLEQERARLSFKVLETEQKHLLTIAGIEVRTHIDRIDELEDGSQVVIDYKTGQPRPASWFGERPDDPQLPIYASADEAPLAAVCFAQLRRGDMAWKGLAREKGLLGNLQDKVASYSDEVQEFSQLKPYWTQVLHQLGEDFRQGRAAVDPREPAVCNYCELGSLCRVTVEQTTVGPGDDA